MKMTHAFATLVFCLFSLTIFAQSPVGKWKTVDDETGKAKSYVEIYEQNGKLYGKITQLLLEADKGKLCAECSGSDKGKPIEGLVFLKDLEKDGKYYEGGTILDPKNGKVYTCYIELKGADKLKVRGYIGIAALGRTQYWYRVK